MGETRSQPFQLSFNALNDSIKQHYARPDVGASILTALANAGKDVNNLKPEDLAPIDEFHIRGREATLELASVVGLGSNMHVLDVGSGLGGPTRCIASKFGCRVTGIDLTDEYVRTAAMLAERVGLSALVTYRQGDALALPFPEAAFDVVWTQHTAMNIHDKTTLYREMFRVLKPGGALAIYDILAGPEGPVYFPVPWARVPETSFLITPDELRRLLETRGFTIVSWEDTTEAARAWFTNLAKKIQESGLPPLGFHVMLGPDFQVMAQNQRRNLEEERIVLAQVVARK
jgi:ubiquinone/menaquinone biosynthesis C-methylase UbiE